MLAYLSSNLFTSSPEFIRNASLLGVAALSLAYIIFIAFNGGPPEDTHGR